MIDNLNVVQTEMIDILFHSRTVVLIILHGNDSALCGDQCRLNGNTLAADDTDIVLMTYMHLI